MSEPTDAAPPADRVKGLIMFLYRGPVNAYWVRVDEEHNDGREFGDDYRPFLFSHDFIRAASPGMIFEVDYRPDFSAVFHEVNPKTKKPQPMNRPYRGRWKNLADNARWRAEHESYAADRDAAAALAKEKGIRYDLDPLNPLREVYARLPAPARAQLIARIVRYVVGG